MASRQATAVLGHIRKLVAVQSAKQLSDRELLRRFVDAHDEAAFAALMHRHGPMVLSACQRVLHRTQPVQKMCVYVSKEKQPELDVARVELYLFETGVAILVIEIEKSPASSLGSDSKSMISVGPPGNSVISSHRVRLSKWPTSRWT